MKFHNYNGIHYLTFEIFPKNVVHAVFTRRGGLSPEPWASLNVGGTVGDENERVRQNRYRSFETLGRERTSIYDVWQIHSADIVMANAAHPRFAGPPELKADGIITDNPAVSLFMRFADCTPILLYDPVKMVIGIVHAGWQGTVKGVAGQAVKMMGAGYGSKPDNILAAIGPSIGPDHYEVGDNVIEQVRYFFGKHSSQVLSNRNGRTHFDLWEANKYILNQAGVEMVEVSNLCTACNTKDWYSHRAQKGRTGRFGALIGLSQSNY